jgi:hypothetical protein
MSGLYEVPVSTLVDREITLPLPPDPRGTVIELVNAAGGCEMTYWPTPEGLWLASMGPPTRVPEWLALPWSQLVAQALDRRMRLFVRRQGPNS